MTAKQASMKRYVDQKRRATSSSFAPGSWVRVKRPLKGHKLKSQLSEPLEVWSKIGNDTYLLQDGQRWHADRFVAIEAPKGAVNTSALSGAAEVSLEGDTFLDMSEVLRMVIMEKSKRQLLRQMKVQEQEIGYREITTQVVRRLRDGLCSMKKNRTLSYYE